MHADLATQLKAHWPLLKSSTPSFVLTLGNEPVFLLFRTTGEADPTRALATIRKSVAGYNATSIVVGTASLVDGALLLVPDTTRSRGTVTANAVTKATVAVAKSIATTVPEATTVLRTALYQEPVADEDALTLDPTTWRAFSNKRFSRRSKELKAIDAAFDKYDNQSSNEEQAAQLAELARAIQTWMETKDGDSGRMAKVQQLAVLVAKERERLAGLIAPEEGVEGGEGMTAALVDRLAELTPAVKARKGYFALAPNKGAPLLVFSPTVLDGAKARKLFSEGNATFAGGTIYVGEVAVQGGQTIFEIVRQSSVGEPNAKDLLNRLVAVANNKLVRAKVDLGFVRTASIYVDGVPEPTLAGQVQTQASTKGKLLGSTFATIQDSITELADIADPEEREEARAGVRAQMATWLDKNAGRTHDDDEAKRTELWGALKALARESTVATTTELRVACGQLKRDVEAALAVVGDEAKRTALWDVDGELLLWLDKAEELGDRASILELKALRGRVKRALDALPEVEDGLDGDALAAGIVDLAKMVRRGATTTREEERTTTFRLAREAGEELLFAADRVGDRDSATQIRTLLAQIDRPWSFETDLPWKPRFRVELRGASERANVHRPNGTSWEDLDRAALETIRDAIEDGQLIRVDETRWIVDVGYPLQVLREVNFTVFEVIHDLTPGRTGGPLVKVAPPDYGDYEKINDAFANPETRAEEERRRRGRVEAGRRLMQNPDYLPYDSVFTETRVGELEQIVTTSGTPRDAVVGLLGEQDMPGVILGEDHTKPDSKRLLREGLAQYQAAGVTTIYIEHFRVEEHQDALDHYLQTGELIEPLKGYLVIQSQKFPEAAYPDDLRGILEEARRLGVRVRGIDSMDCKADPGLGMEKNGVGPQQRAARTNALVGDVINNDGGRNGKYIALLGEKHANSHKGGANGIPGVSQLVKAPVLHVDPGGVELAKENDEDRGKLPETGDRATLLSAVVAAAVPMTDRHGHKMTYKIKLRVPQGATGETYEDGRDGLYSIYGVTMEWWERIERLWYFDTGALDAQGIADAKANGVGQAVLKPWGDLLQYAPNSLTFGAWRDAVAGARAGTLDDPTVIEINDKPGILSSKADLHAKRVLQFRHVVKDSYGKMIEIKAIQILVVEAGQLAYSLYADSMGNRVESNPGARPTTDFIQPGEEQPRFDLDVDLPAIAVNTVPVFLAEIADGRTTPARDITGEAVDAYVTQHPEAKRSAILDVVNKPGNYGNLPLVRSGEYWVERDVGGGTILVALIRDGRAKRMMFTTAAASGQDDFRVDVNGRSDWRDITLPIRAFTDVPLERFDA